MQDSVLNITLFGQPERAYQVHRADLRFSLNSNGEALADIDTLGAQPGMTTDDRGAPDWDAPVGLQLAPLGNGTLSADGQVTLDLRQTPHEPDPQKAIFYYWDHEPIKTLALAIEQSSGTSYRLTATGQSESRHRFDASFPLDLVWVRVETGVPHAQDFAARCSSEGMQFVSKNETAFALKRPKEKRP